MSHSRPLAMAEALADSGPSNFAICGQEMLSVNSMNTGHQVGFDSVKVVPQPMAKRRWSKHKSISGLTIECNVQITKHRLLKFSNGLG